MSDNMARPTHQNRVQALQAATGWQANKISDALAADPLVEWQAQQIVALHAENAELKAAAAESISGDGVRQYVATILAEALKEPTSERLMSDFIKRAIKILKGESR